MYENFLTWSLIIPVVFAMPALLGWSTMTS